MNLEAFKLAVYNWYAKETKLSVIWEEQAEARPQRPYATLNIITGAVMVGEDDHRQDVSGKFTWEGQRKITVSCNIWSDTGLQTMADVQSSLRKASNQLAFNQAGIAPTDYGNVQKLSSLFGNRFEDRFQMDVIFTVVELINDDAVPIESVGLDATAIVGGKVTVIN